MVPSDEEEDETARAVRSILGQEAANQAAELEKKAAASSESQTRPRNHHNNNNQGKSGNSRGPTKVLNAMASLRATKSSNKNEVEDNKENSSRDCQVIRNDNNITIMKLTYQGPAE